MTLITFVDAISLANAQQARHANGTAFYLRGGNAFRAWTPAEISGIRTRYRLPIFVRSNPTMEGLPADIEVTKAGLAACGAPKGTLVALDSEMTVDPEYVRGYWAGIRQTGYHLIDYGSQSVVFGNKNPDGYYWGADWTSVPHLHSGDMATQYVSFSNYDASEFSSALPLWDTQAPSHAPDVTYLNSAQTGAIMAKLPVITLDMNDTELPHLYIGGRIQPILNATWHAGLVVDGIYGPKTQAEIVKLQKLYGLPASENGKVGPATWALLVAGDH